MEEGSVLVVRKVVIELLIPYHASSSRLHRHIVSTQLLTSGPACITHRDIDHFEPKCPSHEVIAKNRSPLDAGKSPSLSIGVGDVESCDSYGEDLVSRFGDVPLDSLLVGIAEDRGHGETR
jgi:hypothetical protein